MRDARTDANQQEIVDALRSVGCSVQDLHSVGHGCPDLLVGLGRWRELIPGFRVFESVNILLEVKTQAGRLNKREQAWHADWRGQVAVVRSVDEALEAVGLR